jgi:cytochrome b subunit of formate dehydrogenase
MGSFDFGVGMAFWLMIASAILCVVYGVVNWNKDKAEPVLDTRSWERDEDKINEEL